MYLILETAWFSHSKQALVESFIGKAEILHNVTFIQKLSLTSLNLQGVYSKISRYLDVYHSIALGMHETPRELAIVLQLLQCIKLSPRKICNSVVAACLTV